MTESESMIWCLVLLINVPSRMPSGADIVTKLVCQGDAVQLFSKIAFCNGSDVSVYTIDGNGGTLIGTGKSLAAFSILKDYKTKMYFDELQTIWILKYQSSDKRKYELRIQTDTTITIDKVQIDLMDAPTKYCRPKLLKTDSALIASLESSECGYPTASVKWVEYPGISYMDTDKSTVKLPSGKESGTYYACAESPALKCVTDLKISDYCSSLVVEANSSSAVSPSNTQQSSERELMFAILAIVVVILGVVLIILGHQIKKFRDMLTLVRDQRGNSLLSRRSTLENEESM